MKKYSWIVALFIALTVIFIGCGVDPIIIPPDESETFTEVPLGEYNFFGGAPADQKGWASDGISDASKKLGYDAEDFRTAKYLVLELKDGGIKGGLSVIWGVEGPNGEEKELGLSNPGWTSKQIVENSGTPNPALGAILNGNIFKIELSKALDRYDVYSAAEGLALKLVIAYYQGIDNLIEKAYLQISDQEPEFFPATKIEVNAPANAVAFSRIALTATITPEATSVQAIMWQIVEKSGNLVSIDDVNFAPNYYVDTNFDPPITTDIIESRAKNAIYVTSKDGGKVTVRATLKGAGLDAEGNKKDIISDDFDITVAGNPFYGFSFDKATNIPMTGNNWNLKAALSANPPAKYFIVVTYGSKLVDSNIGATQWVLQSTNSGWHQMLTGDGTKIDKAPDSNDFYYMVFDLTKFGKDEAGNITGSAYTSAIADAAAGYAQLVLNYGAADLGLIQGYVVDANVTITPPAETGDVVVIPFESTSHPSGLNWGAGDAIGYVTNAVPGGVKWE